MTTLRVAVDARTVYSPRRRGTGKTLIDLYRRIAAQQPGWTFDMFHRQAQVADDPFAAVPNIRHCYVDVRGDRWNLWQQLRLPLAAAAAKASVLHAPANTAPRLSRTPLVVTIHDLIPLDASPRTEEEAAWGAAVHRASHRAAHILTPSTFTKGRLVKEFGVSADKITVNYWAPDGACQRVTDEGALDAVRVRYGLRAGQRYIFGFGAPDPRKNTERIITAWAGLAPAIRAETALLLVGLDEDAALQAARACARSLAPDGGWSLMPFAPERDVPALLSGATALCYPSLNEGFGLPVLDAFVCGTPVITSASSSLPEVTGDAGLLVDPTDVGAIRDAMARLATDTDLAARLRADGFDRVGEFSWDRCARTAAGVLAAAA
jgi:glycosyltransferase involved in cell wall biosynthesis